MFPARSQRAGGPVFPARCCGLAADGVNCPEFRRVSADRTFGGDDLWRMDFGAQDGPSAAGSVFFLLYRAALAVRQPITRLAATAWLITGAECPA